MKSRKSHIPRSIARSLVGSTVMQRNRVHGGGSRSAQDTRLFADGIIGKYGFWRSDYVGRLAFVFRELEGKRGRVRKDGSAHWQQMIEKLQAQLAALQHADAKHVVTRSETIHRLERLIHYYGGLPDGRQQQAPTRLEQARIADKILQGTPLGRELERVRQGQSRDDAPTGDMVHVASVEPSSRKALIDDLGKSNGNAGNKGNGSDKPGQSIQQELALKQKPGQAQDPKQNKNQVQEHKQTQRQIKKQKQWEKQQQLKQQIEERAEAQAKKWSEEQAKERAKERIKERVKERVKERAEAQAKDRAENQTKIYQAFNKQRPDLLHKATASLDEPDRLSNDGIRLSSPRASGVIRWASDDNQPYVSVLAKQQHETKNNSGLNKADSATSPGYFIQAFRKNSNESALMPIAWHPHPNANPSLSSFDGLSENRQQQLPFVYRNNQSSNDRPTATDASLVSSRYLRSNKVNMADIIQRQHTYMLPPSYKVQQASPIGQASVYQQSNFVSVRSVNKVDRFNNSIQPKDGFLNHEHNAGIGELNQPLSRQQLQPFRSTVVQQAVPSARLEHTTKLIHQLFATYKARLGQPEIHNQTISGKQGTSPTYRELWMNRSSIKPESINRQQAEPESAQITDTESQGMSSLAGPELLVRARLSNRGARQIDETTGAQQLGYEPRNISWGKGVLSHFFNDGRTSMMPPLSLMLLRTFDLSNASKMSNHGLLGPASHTSQSHGMQERAVLAGERMLSSNQLVQRSVAPAFQLGEPRSEAEAGNSQNGGSASWLDVENAASSGPVLNVVRGNEPAKAAGFSIGQQAIEHAGFSAERILQLMKPELRSYRSMQAPIDLQPLNRLWRAGEDKAFAFRKQRDSVGYSAIVADQTLSNFKELPADLVDLSNTATKLADRQLAGGRISAKPNGNVAGYLQMAGNIREGQEAREVQQRQLRRRQRASLALATTLASGDLETGRIGSRIQKAAAALQHVQLRLKSHPSSRPISMGSSRQAHFALPMNNRAKAQWAIYPKVAAAIETNGPLILTSIIQRVKLNRDSLNRHVVTTATANLVNDWGSSLSNEAAVPAQRARKKAESSSSGSLVGAVPELQSTLESALPNRAKSANVAQPWIKPWIPSSKAPTDLPPLESAIDHAVKTGLWIQAKGLSWLEAGGSQAHGRTETPDGVLNRNNPENPAITHAMLANIQNSTMGREARLSKRFSIQAKVEEGSALSLTPGSGALSPVTSTSARWARAADAETSVVRGRAASNPASTIARRARVLRAAASMLRTSAMPNPDGAVAPRGVLSTADSLAHASLSLSALMARRVSMNASPKVDRGMGTSKLKASIAPGMQLNIPIPIPMANVWRRSVVPSHPIGAGQNSVALNSSVGLPSQRLAVSQAAASDSRSLNKMYPVASGITSMGISRLASQVDQGALRKEASFPWTAATMNASRASSQDEVFHTLISASKALGLQGGNLQRKAANSFIHHQATHQDIASLQEAQTYPFQRLLDSKAGRDGDNLNLGGMAGHRGEAPDHHVDIVALSNVIRMISRKAINANIKIPVSLMDGISPLALAVQSLEHRNPIDNFGRQTSLTAKPGSNLNRARNGQTLSSITGLLNRSASQPAGRRASQPASRIASQSVSPVSESVSRLVNQPVDTRASWSANRPVNRPLSELAGPVAAISFLSRQLATKKITPKVNTSIAASIAADHALQATRQEASLANAWLQRPPRMEQTTAAFRKTNVGQAIDTFTAIESPGRRLEVKHNERSINEAGTIEGLAAQVQQRTTNPESEEAIRLVKPSALTQRSRITAAAPATRLSQQGFRAARVNQLAANANVPQALTIGRGLSRAAAAPMSQVPRSAAQRANANGQPAAQRASANGQPAVQRASANGQPAVQRASANGQPAVQRAGTNARSALQRTAARMVSGDERLAVVSPGLLQRRSGAQPDGSYAAIATASTNATTTTQAPVSLRYSDLAGASANQERNIFAKPASSPVDTADIFAYSPRTPVAPGMPSTQLEHKQPEPKTGYPASVSSPSLELLKPQRQAEPEAAQAITQPVEPAELTEEQINELVKQLPQLDVNQIVDKVTRELERRMRFERQRRGM
ncbi:hypothetical protein [Paenibacillus agricola]|uniref:Uncharacterized protein n=1 Tax=Paenibacillus agricola TaxID=2716264 RepID=A0ABX0J9G6_9BACL|nr:hypothetical protein [Paenibacillus agricola]NHN32421.1 hypothetical protein [Paenibacillus agricola]